MCALEVLHWIGYIYRSKKKTPKPKTHIRFGFVTSGGETEI